MPTIIAALIASTTFMPTSAAIFVVVALALVPAAVVVPMAAVGMPLVPTFVTAVTVTMARRVLRVIAGLFPMLAAIFARPCKPYWRHPAVITVVTVVDLPASLFDIAGAGRRILVRQPAFMLGLRCRGSRQYAGHQRDRCRANGQFRSDS